MKRKIKKLTIELGAFLLLSLSLTTSLPDSTGANEIVAEYTDDAIPADSDDRDEPKQNPNLGKL